jgi:hypothetical protein
MIASGYNVTAAIFSVPRTLLLHGVLINSPGVIQSRA